MPRPQFRSFAATHPGAVRTENQDSFVDRPDLGLWAVADGAGGHSGGEIAAGLIRTALEDIRAGLSPAQLLAQVRLRLAGAHEAVREEALRRDVPTIASTVVVLIARGTHFACLWAGDSRIYLLRAGRLVQMTRDHSLVQEMVDAGTITAAEAEGHPRANVITRAVGAGANGLELDKITDRLASGDRFLLCSDGLCKTLDGEALRELLQEPPDAQSAERLVSAALDRRVSDNVTAVTVEVMAVPDAG